MPAWIHNRAEHLLAKSPSMPKSQAFAVATQQSHAQGKSPKSYGTAQGKREAKEKYDEPKKSYESKANPGGLDSPKLAELVSMDARKKFREAALAELGPASGAVLGAGLGAALRINPLAGAAAGYGVGAIPEVVHAIRHRGNQAASPLEKTPGMIPDNANDTLRKQAFSISPATLEAMKAELGPAAGAVLGAGTANALGINPLAGAAAGYGLGATGEIIHGIRHRGVAPAKQLKDQASGLAKEVVASAFFDEFSDLMMLPKLSAEQLVGGKADGMTDAGFDKKQVAMGKKVEQEHTKDPEKVKEIVRDHLVELDDYYTRLKNMEAGAEKKAATTPSVEELAVALAQRAKKLGEDPMKSKKSSADDGYSPDTMQWAEGGSLLGPSMGSVKAAAFSDELFKIGFDAVDPGTAPQQGQPETQPVRKPLSAGALAGIGAGIGALGVGAGALGATLLRRGRGAGQAAQQVAKQVATPAAHAAPALRAADPYAATRISQGSSDYVKKGLDSLDPAVRSALGGRAAQMGKGMDENAAYQLMHMGAADAQMPLGDYIKHELAGTAVGVKTPSAPSVVGRAQQQALASLPAPNLPTQSLEALRGSSGVQQRVRGGMSEAEALHQGMNEYHRRMRQAAVAGEIDPKAMKLHDYIAKVGSSGWLDEMFKIAGSNPYLLSQIGKEKVRAASVSPPNPKYSVKQAMIPTTPSPIGSSLETPEKRLARAQKVGTPQDPNGPKIRPLNMLQPPKIASVQKLALGFATSDFAGGQLYPSPRSMRLPVSGEAPTLPIARDPQLKYGGPPGDKLKEKKANVLSPAAQLSTSQREGARRLSRPGLAAGNDMKPVGFGKPLFAKNWANRDGAA